MPARERVLLICPVFSDHPNDKISEVVYVGINCSPNHNAELA